jgi:hypothetical protein
LLLPNTNGEETVQLQCQSLLCNYCCDYCLDIIGAEGEAERHSSALADVCIDSSFTPVQGSDTPDNRETKARTTAILGPRSIHAMEAIKDPRNVFRGNSATVIRYRNHQGSVAAGRFQPDMTAPAGVRQ